MIYYGEITFYDCDTGKQIDHVVLAAENFVEAQQKIVDYYGADLIVSSLEEINDNEAICVFKENVKDKIDSLL